MKVVVVGEDCLSSQYEISIGAQSLVFVGEKGVFSLPYSEINDFYITQCGSGKTYFTLFCSTRMFEGQILETDKIRQFAANLRSVIGGVISVEVRKP